MESCKSYCSCTECGQVFAYESYLADHMKTHCVKLCKPKILLHCNVCGKSFSCRSNLMQHMKIHSAARSFTCSECGKTLSRKSGLTRHMIVHSSHKLFKCNECGKCFSMKSSLIHHVRLHTGEKLFRCLVCREYFYQKAKLSDHQRLCHFQDISFDSTDCGKKTVKCGNVYKNEFMNTLNNENPHKSNENVLCNNIDRACTLIDNAFFICEICGQSFPCRSNLLQHKREHSVSKCFHCSICEKNFFFKSSLTKHMNIHAGYKPYICQKCRKSFSEQSALILHVRLHMFRCGECGLAFNYESELNRHKLLHHIDERAFGCGVCGKTFVEKCALDEHWTQHGDKSMAVTLATTQCHTVGNDIPVTQKIHLAKQMEVKINLNKCFQSPDFINTVRIEKDSEWPNKPFLENICFVKMEDDLVEYTDESLKVCSDSVKMENDPLEIKIEIKNEVW